MAFAGAACLLGGCASAAKTSEARLTTTTTTTTISTPPTTSSTVPTTASGPTTTPTLPPLSTSGTTVAPPRAASTTTTTVAPLNPGIVRAPVDGAIQITAADRYDTFAVALGQKVELTLSTAEMKYSEVEAEPSGLLQVDPSSLPPENGQLVVWTAVAPGTVTVSSGASAVCGPPINDACPMFVLLWSVKLVIS